MILGVDFDNTIVCYDEVFHAAAVDRGLIPADLPVNKDSVRNYLRQCGQEDAWTRLQGHVYGPQMCDALPFPGALEFLGRCVQAGLPLWIISHKTRHPYLGPQYDLHESARRWLADHGVHEAGLAPDHVIFELTKLDKLQRIGQIGCTHFIDDLPEFLAEPTFPAGVEGILFDPNCHHAQEQRFPRLCAWSEAWELLCP